MKTWQFICLFWLLERQLPDDGSGNNVVILVVAIVSAVAMYNEWRASRAGGKT